MKRTILAFLALVCVVSITDAFVSPQLGSKTVAISVRSKTTSTTTSSSSQLSERRWNFNDGVGPWGLKKNAEIWNGRAAQMGFIIVLLQEVITGKGVIAGLKEGDPVNIAFLVGTVLSVVGLTAWLAIKGDDELEGMEDVDIADYDTQGVWGGGLTPDKLKKKILEMDPQKRAEMEEAMKGDPKLREGFKQLNDLAGL